MNSFELLRKEAPLRMKALASRDLQLWSVGVLVLLVLATGLVALVLPNLVWKGEAVRFELRYLPQLAFGLLALTVLFNLYIFEQRRELNNAREALLRQLLLRDSQESGPLVDPATRTFHRRLLGDLLGREMDRLRRRGGSLALVLVQVHGVRAVTRRFGEAAAQGFLLETAELLEAGLHGSEMIFRYADDQFLLLLRDTAPEQAALALEQVAMQVEAWNNTGSQKHKMTLTAAHACCSARDDTSTVLSDLEQQVQRKKKESDRSGSLYPVCMMLGCSAPVVGVLRPMLESMGAAVEVYGQREEGLDLLARRKFDGIILEAEDPATTSELLRNVRALPSAKSAVLLLVLPEGVSAEAGFKMGANLVLTRPVTADMAVRSLRAAYGIMLAERRRYFRHAVEMSVTVRLGGGRQIDATSTNLSEGGMALRSLSPLPVNSVVTLHFTLPATRKAIEVKGEVGWRDSEGCLGVRFVAMERATRRLIERWRLQRLEQEADSDHPHDSAALLQPAGMPKR